MIEIFRDKAGQWRFRIKARNGEILAQSEAYTRQADAIRGINDLCEVMGTSSQHMDMRII